MKISVALALAGSRTAPNALLYCSSKMQESLTVMTSCKPRTRHISIASPGSPRESPRGRNHGPIYPLDASQHSTWGISSACSHYTLAPGRCSRHPCRQVVCKATAPSLWPLVSGPYRRWGTETRLVTIVILGAVWLETGCGSSDAKSFYLALV